MLAGLNQAASVTSSYHCHGYIKKQTQKTCYTTVSKPNGLEQTFSLRERKQKKGQMPKEAELKSMQFPPLTSLARGNLWSFPAFFSS
jgi:hypothetical protein